MARCLTATDEKYLKTFGEEKLNLKHMASAIANVLLFRSHQLTPQLIRQIGEMIIKELPDTEHYIDLNDEWMYRGDNVYEHRKTHEIRRYQY